MDIFLLMIFRELLLRKKIFKNNKALKLCFVEYHWLIYCFNKLRYIQPSNDMQMNLKVYLLSSNVKAGRYLHSCMAYQISGAPLGRCTTKKDR